jgi:predicted ATPase
MRHVLTGGPGAGKTTLVEALAATGLPVVPESGRAIIRDQVAAGGDALPWRDAARFAEAMIEADITAYRTAPAGPVIFDRGIPDTIGYLRLTGLPVPRRLAAAARRARYGRIFVAPPWPAIYRTDSERRQDLAEARATHDAIVAAYRELGHRPLRLPRTGVAARVRYVLARLADDRPVRSGRSAARGRPFTGRPGAGPGGRRVTVVVAEAEGGADGQLAVRVADRPADSRGHRAR